MGKVSGYIDLKDFERISGKRCIEDMELPLSFYHYKQTLNELLKTLAETYTLIGKLIKGKTRPYDKIFIGFPITELCYKKIKGLARIDHQPFPMLIDLDRLYFNYKNKEYFMNPFSMIKTDNDQYYIFGDGGYSSKR